MVSGLYDRFYTLALRRSVVLRAFRISMIVGSILAVINHGDHLIRMDLDAQRLAKILLTYLVPYCVSTYSSVLALREA